MSSRLIGSCRELDSGSFFLFLRFVSCTGWLPCWEPAHMRQSTLDSASYSDQLSCNSDRNFFGCNRPNIEANRGVYAIEKMLRQALFDQFSENGDCLAFRANHSDITRLGLHCPAQHPHVVAMTTCDDDDVGSLSRRNFRHRQIEVFTNHLARVRKAFAVSIVLAVVDDGHIEPRIQCGVVKAARNVPCAENVERCGRE